MKAKLQAVSFVVVIIIISLVYLYQDVFSYSYATSLVCSKIQKEQHEFKETFGITPEMYVSAENACGTAVASYAYTKALFDLDMETANYLREHMKSTTQDIKDFSEQSSYITLVGNSKKVPQRAFEQLFEEYMETILSLDQTKFYYDHGRAYNFGPELSVINKTAAKVYELSIQPVYQSMDKNEVNTSYMFLSNYLYTFRQSGIESVADQVYKLATLISETKDANSIDSEVEELILRAYKAAEEGDLENALLYATAAKTKSLRK